MTVKTTVSTKDIDEAFLRLKELLLKRTLTIQPFLFKSMNVKFI